MSDPKVVPGLLTFLMFAAAGCLWLVFQGRRRGDSPSLPLALFLVSYALRFSASIAIYRFGLVAVFGDEDGVGWQRGAALQEVWAREGVRAWRLPFVAFAEVREWHEGYRALLASLFHLTGAPGRLPAAALGGFCGALTVVLTYRIARALFTPRVATYAGWLACFWPSLIVWSALTIKEPVVLMLETAVLYMVTVARQNGCALTPVALSTVLISLLCQLRYYAGYMAAVTLAPVLARPLTGCRRPAAVIASFVFLLLLVVEFRALEEPEHLGALNARRQFHTLAFYEGFKSSVSNSSYSGSGARTNLDLHDPLGFAATVVIGAAHLALAPFPWNFRGASPRLLCVIPEQVVWWWLVFAGVMPGLRYAIRSRWEEMLPFSVFLGVLGLFYSLMFGNIGLAYRQRNQFLPWLLILAAVGLARRARAPVETPARPRTPSSGPVAVGPRDEPAS